MRPIDADRFEVLSYTERSKDFTEGVEFVVDLIDKAPTINIRNNCGVWLVREYLQCNTKETRYHCSECDFESGHIYPGAKSSSFCPECGSRNFKTADEMREYAKSIIGEL